MEMVSLSDVFKALAMEMASLSDVFIALAMEMEPLSESRYGDGAFI